MHPSSFELWSRNQSLVKLVGRPVPRLSAPPESSMLLRQALGGGLWFPPRLKGPLQDLPGVRGDGPSLGQALQTTTTQTSSSPCVHSLEVGFRGPEIICTIPCVCTEGHLLFCILLVRTAMGFPPPEYPLHSTFPQTLAVHWRALLGIRKWVKLRASSREGGGMGPW